MAYPYTPRWQRARLQYLRVHPLCVMCLPHIVSATVVDHIVPHGGDEALFWNTTNWQSLCVTCHSKHKRLYEERGYYDHLLDKDGWPTDPMHPSNKKK